MKRWILILSMLAAAGCSDSHTPGDDGGTSEDGGRLDDGGPRPDGGDCTLPTPAEHRTAATACSMDRPSTTPDPTAMGDCTTDADCAAGINGRCINGRGYFFCSYDTCFADSECTGGPCLCRGEGGGVGTGGANRCAGGNCRTDGDCGAGGWCSPTLGTCGDYGGVVGYYCHTCDDECTDDSECASPTMGPGYCAYEPTVAHWMCQYSQCAG